MSLSGGAAACVGHVRVRRGKDTVFVAVDVGRATAGEAGARAAWLLGVAAGEVRLCAAGDADGAPLRELRAELPLAQQGVRNDALLCAVVGKEPPALVAVPEPAPDKPTRDAGG